MKEVKAKRLLPLRKEGVKTAKQNEVLDETLHA